MAMVPQAVPKIKPFLKPLHLKERALAMVIRLMVAFMLHAARMSAVQVAGAIKSDPCHRAQVCRCLGRQFWSKYRPLETLRAALLACEGQRGRFVFLLDQTHNSQQGQKAENTFSTGSHPRHPRPHHRYKKYKYARKSGHCFVMGLLIALPHRAESETAHVLRASGEAGGPIRGDGAARLFDKEVPKRHWQDGGGKDSHDHGSEALDTEDRRTATKKVFPCHRRAALGTLSGCRLGEAGI